MPYAIEESHRALEMWREITLAGLRAEGPDLSPRQMALLMTVYVTPGPHTVRGLADALSLAKPAVVRAVDALSAEDLLRRKPDPADGRNVLIQRTVRGSVFLSEFADRIIAASRKGAA